METSDPKIHHGQLFDPATNQDDPLLLALLAICKLYKRPQSADFLIAGLPLEDRKLTPALFIRAAERAGLSASLIQRPLEQISSLVLPAILILNNQQTCILTRKEKHQIHVVIPETQTGEKIIDPEDLQEYYSGFAIFVQPQYQFDDSMNTGQASTPKHWFWDVIFQSWPVYSEVLIASILINLFALASPLFIMNVYDRVVPNQAIETLWVLAAGVFIVFSFDLLMKILRGYFIDAAGKRADIILSSTIFEKILGIRMAVKPASTGAFANNLHEFESFRDFLTSATLATLIDLPFLIFFLAIIWLIGESLVTIPLIAIPLALAAGLIIQKPLKSTIQKLFGLSAAKSATLIEALGNLEPIKTVNAEGQLQKQWEENIGEIAKLGMKSRFLASIAIHVSLFFQQIASISVVIFGVYKIADGDLTTGGLIACTILTGRCLAPMSQVASLLTRYHQAKASLGSLNELMNLPGERTNKKPLTRPASTGNIEFKNVSFSYPDQPQKTLNQVSFKIKAGEKIAILGRIGSGKSTLEKLILALYEPQEGSILIDGTEIKQIYPATVRRQIGYVPQDISLMRGTIYDNIIFGGKYVDEHSISKAAKIAGVSDFTNQNALGLDIQVGERGAALSGGQKQSIALARALLHNPPIYILDEPTNAMDSRSEETFKQRFANHLQENQTLILITHRASLLTLVDRIIVLDNGKIVADGAKQQVLDALKHGRISASV